MKKRVFIYNISSSKILNLANINKNIQNIFDFCTVYIKNKKFNKYNLENSKNNIFDSFSELLLYNSKISNLKKENKFLKVNKNHSHSQNIQKQIGQKYFDLYDGFILQNYYSQFLNSSELDIDDIHIIITDKLICTFDSCDNRYHARTIVCGVPTLISTSGIVEGPAKPKDYYFKQIFFSRQPNELEQIEDEFKNRCIHYNDKRINSVIEGLICQSIFYNILSANHFCKYDFCRLYNAHWQEELISIHVNKKKFCPEHENILKKYRNNKSQYITC
ncbi:MAG: DUF6775 family putative metallopeptidase [Nitrososphaeraceae archaeon]